MIIYVHLTGLQQSECGRPNIHSPIKEARISFCCLEIKISYRSQSLLSYWFPSNSCYHSDSNAWPLINLDNSYHFPSCSGGTIAPHNSFTPSLLHFFTPSLLHSFTPSFLHSFTPSLLHSFTPSLLHSFTPSLLHYFTFH